MAFIAKRKAEDKNETERKANLRKACIEYERRQLTERVRQDAEAERVNARILMFAEIPGS